MSHRASIIGLAAAIAAIAAGCSLLPPAACQTVTAEESAFFESKVRPILYEKCFSCHADKLQRGGVRLDSRAEILKEASAQKVVAPGDPEASALVHVVRYDGKIQMPPGAKLPQSAIDTLTQWVKRGAPWPNSAPVASYTIKPSQRQFWSFQPIKKTAPPAVKQKQWVRNPVDAFILAGLEAKGLKPAHAADRRTLIRRATFDLTGLPPTAQEVSAFLADKSPVAYQRLIDRLLASPRYGERWGRHWLDVARYADSADARGLGSEGDISESWRYRDWVVNAFNNDMGYDQFVMNQVAGDLLPDPANPRSSLNVPGTIATGLLAIGNWGNGDADKEKLVTDIADDQVDIVSRGFMALTVGCARCHDHKFDPIPTKDYYGLAGIFFSSHILPRLTPKGQGEVMLRIPLETEELKAERTKYEASVAAANKKLAADREAAFQAYCAQMRPLTAKYLLGAVDYHNRPAAQSGQSLEQFAKTRELSPVLLKRWESALIGGDYPLLTSGSKDSGGKPGVYSWRGKPDCPNMVINTTSAPVTITTLTLPPRSVAVHPGPANGVAVEWVSPIKGSIEITGKVADADPNGGDGIAWGIDHWHVLGVGELASGEFPNTGSQDFSAGKGAASLKHIEVSVGDRIQLVVLPKADYICDTTTVNFVIKQIGSDKQWDLTSDMMEDPIRSNPRADRYGNADVWRFSDMADIRRERRLTGASGAALARFERDAASAATHAELEMAAQKIQTIFDANDPRNPFRPDGEDLSSLPADLKRDVEADTAALAELKKQAPAPAGIANGIQEGGIPDCPTSGIHDVRVHIRGRYDRLGDLVPRHFPIILAGEQQPAINKGSGRLELARWLVNDKHPLTSRVIVNRIWQHHFGEGIVRTPSNFGLLGDRPSNPALLDWLAATFKEPVPAKSNAYSCGWSLKRMHRLIMLSNTYQQASDADLATAKLDPDNRLFGRYNRQRMEAEGIRDTLLAASGSLDTKMGGIATRDFNAPRRTLYVMTIRSDRSGYAPLFDTADPTSSVEKRVVSTVAPQALFLMNNAFVANQSKALAKLAIAEGGASDAARIAWLYQRLYSRPASERELKIGIGYLNRSRVTGLRQASLDADTERELRAWQGYCGILLCANELIYID